VTIKICVSLPPRTITQALTLIEEAELQNADIIEIRLDYLKDNAKLSDIPPSTTTPMIATNRSNLYHGEFQGNEKKRHDILIEAATSGFEYVDLELSTPHLVNTMRTLQNIDVKPIISFHDFTSTPDVHQLNQILTKELESGAHLCKIVTTAQLLEDNLTTLKFTSTVGKTTRIVCFAMGDLGKASRLLSPLFGASFTIACLGQKHKTAPGQLSISEMKTAYNALGLG
jgi:3-dehydroquinate dehydratase type I